MFYASGLRVEHLSEEVAGGLAAAARLHAVPVEGVVPRLLGGGSVC